MHKPIQPNWPILSTDKTLALLDTHATKGLTTKEAHVRLKKYGKNILKATRITHWYTILVRQFTQDILILILIAAAAIAFAIGEITDGFTILTIIILNGALGFLQEWRAEQAITALKKMLSPQCRVMRDNIEQIINADQLVPGDIVVLEIGNRVPADLRLVKTINLQVDESALTGESMPATKQTSAVAENTPLAEQRSMARMGTNITNGFAHGIVVATGMQTEFGRIAKLTEDLEDETTHLQKKLATLGKQLGIASIGIVVVIALLGWLFGKPLTTMLFAAISLGVAVVPEGLPTVVTITMTLGIRIMSRRRALLRRLQAAETLGATTAICTDKTGTLTKNQMTVTQIWLPSTLIDVTGVGYIPEGEFQVQQQPFDAKRNPDLSALLTTGLICNHAQLFKDDSGWHPFGAPTEAALITAAYKAEIFVNASSENISEFSFNSKRKRMTVIAHHPKGKTAHVKGAPEIILERATFIQENSKIRPLTQHDRTQIIHAYTKMADQGLRTLALARRTLDDNLALTEDNVEKELVLLGIVGIIDPPRPEVARALQIAHQAGIKIIMITGDAPLTASAIAKQVGMQIDNIITGLELQHTNDEVLMQLLDGNTLFARTTPEDKLRLVTLLQRLGHIVGMTGDGVNDAPALKKADIGIAMGVRGTDVAKSASDMVLTDDNFASIIGAIEEGRRQFNNIIKFVRYMLSSNLGEVCAIFFNVLFGGPLILLPVQILWMNLVTDGVTAISLGVEHAEKDIMQHPPQNTDSAILTKPSIIMIFILGIYIGLATLWLFHHYNSNYMLAQSVAFTGIIIIEKFNVLNFRTLHKPLKSIGFFSNPWLLIAIAFNVALQAGVIYLPFMQELFHTTALGWSQWGMIILTALPIFLVTECYKWIRQSSGR